MPTIMSSPGENKNPLLIEFYPHTSCECYKIKLPWTKHRCHKVVLCNVALGIEHAQRLARKVIAEHLDHALAEPISTDPKAT